MHLKLLLITPNLLLIKALLLSLSRRALTFKLVQTVEINKTDRIAILKLINKHNEQPLILDRLRSQSKTTIATMVKMLMRFENL